MRCVLFFYFIFLFILLSSCTNKDVSDENINYTIEEHNGVKFVHNLQLKTDKTLPIRLEHHMTIGELDVTAENYLFSIISDANIDKEGNILIVDTKENRIQKFNKYGMFISTIGRFGQGPCEFNQPDCLTISNSGDLIVTETRNRRIQIISGTISEGGNVKIYPMMRAYISVLSLHNKNLIINTIDLSRGKDTATQRTKRIIIADYNMKPLKEFLDNKIYNLRSPKARHWASFLGNWTAITSDKDDNIFVAYQTENLIEKYNSSGELLTKFDRHLGFPIPIEPLVENGYPVFTHTTVNIATDQKGRVWTHTYFKKPDIPEGGLTGNCIRKYLHFEVYDNDGHQLGIMNPFEDYVMLRIVGDKMLLIDNERVSLYIYKIVG